MGPSSAVAAPVTAGAATRSRPPWWLVFLAASFVGYFLLLVRTDLRRPEAAGFTFTIDSRGMTLESVVPGSPAHATGLQPGDRVLAAAGRTIRNRLDWHAFEANFDISQPVALDLARGSERVHTALTLMPAPPSFWRTTAGVTVATARLAQLATLLLALVVLFKRPFDQTARVGAWLLGTVAVYSLALPYGLAAEWRALPRLVGFPLWIPYASSLSVAPIILTFFAGFPQPLLHSRLVWVALWIPVLPVVFVQLRYAHWLVYTPGQPMTWGDWTSAAVTATVVYAVAAVVAAVVGYRRETDLTERRRVRVLASGSIVGMLGVLPIVVDYARADAVLGSTVFASPAAAIGALVGLMLPASFAYAVLRHRLFDVSIIVRRSLQHALARQVLVSIVPFATVAFLADLWLNQRIPVGEILQARGWVYAGLAVFAIVARVRRRAWLSALDRRFFRERYNAQRVLRSIGDEVRRAPDMPAFAPHIVTRIEEALHPELAALLVRQPGEDHYRVVAAAPVNVSLLPLPADSTIAGLLGLLQHPVRIPAREDEGLLGQLPPEDLDWVRRHRLELLVPSRFAADGSGAFFALGPRRSEQPYSAEDEDLLMTIGHGVALLLSQSSQGGFEECPACGICYPPGAARCSQDGSMLAQQTLSRVLSDRYRLERRIGRGGMGAVYAAEDTALGRRVAVKLLREDLGDPSAAERFRAEAQIAAGLSHPNIVTVYDTGVTTSGRPFFVMELLEGLTLAEELRRTGRLAPARALYLLKGVGAAVRAAHARQMIHRDLKPENIFLCRTDAGEVPKVLDFGLAKALEATGLPALTRPGLVAGTPRYMAPEHLRGREASPDWDLWALAAIALEMLSGSDALDGPPGAAHQFDHLSPGLRRVFSLALSPDPLDRPTSVDELLDALERALAEHEPST
jgi:serine/threonine-protein kinase